MLILDHGAIKARSFSCYPQALSFPQVKLKDKAGFLSTQDGLSAAKPIF
jgi:hypothetical protein